MSNPESVKKKKTSNCVLPEHSVNAIVECIRQFFISADNEAQFKDHGLLTARDNLIRSVQESFSSITSVLQLCIDNTYHVSHSFNVATMSVAVGIKIGLKHEDLSLLALSALAHDIGKLKLPDQILYKSGKLTPKEKELYALHVPLGYKMAKDELLFNPTVCRIILEHHENSNGSGYPRGLSGQDIHQLAMIIHVVSKFDTKVNKSHTPNPASVSDIIKEMLYNNELYNPQALYSLVHMVRFTK
ncbi:MAG: HD-GYP domain-containing protein [Vampirovibrionia bacterium]